LTSVIYLGKNDPIELNAIEIFNGCNQLRFVCVPTDYNNDSFCGIKQFCKYESCESFLHHTCNEPICGNGTKSMKKRENVTEWEKRSNECYDYMCDEDRATIVVGSENATEWESNSNECYEYRCIEDSGEAISVLRENMTEWESKSTGCYAFECDKDRGPIYWKQCNKSDEICENDQCVIGEEVTFAVVVTVEGVDVTSFNMAEFQSTISNLTSVEADAIRVRFVTNDKGEVIQIIVIVKDEKTAESINSKIKEHEKEGILRCVVSSKVEVKEKELFISSELRTKGEMKITIAVAVLILFIHNRL